MPMPKNLEECVENVRTETIVRNLDLEVLNRAHTDIHNRIGWKQDSFDEEPYPASDDDYQRAVLAAELLDVIERMRDSDVIRRCEEASAAAMSMFIEGGNR